MPEKNISERSVQFSLLTNLTCLNYVFPQYNSALHKVIYKLICISVYHSRLIQHFSEKLKKYFRFCNWRHYKL